MNTTYLHAYHIVKVEEQKGHIIFHTNDIVKVQVDVLEKGTLRLWVNLDGKLKEPKSYAIEKTPRHCTEYKLIDSETHYEIHSPSLCMYIQKECIHISFYKPDGTLLTQECMDTGIGWRSDGHIFYEHDMKEDEHFYGLGEDNDAYLGTLDRRGSKRDMISEQRINVGHVTADIPISFFMSSDEEMHCYGIFTDTSYLVKYDMGKEKKDRYMFEAAGGDLINYVFGGADFREILTSYTDITGKASMLPRWTMGFIQSYCCYRTWPEMEDVIQQSANHDIPLDSIVFDFDWAKSTHNFEWDASWEGKTPEKIAEYRKQGIEFMISNCGPMLKKDSTNMQEAIDAGILARDMDGNLITCGHYGGTLMDFSNPDMKAWLKPYLMNILKDGVKGWWLDLTEPEGDIEETMYHDGPRKQVHNVYSILNSKLYYEVSKEYDETSRPFILTRTGSAGIQKYGNAIWTGDVFSDYKTLQAHCPEALNTTMSGIANWTCDSGGFISSTYAGSDNVQLYNNDPGAHALLYERWMQLACFSPIARAHHVGPASPYMFGDLILSGCRHYIQLRQRLLPYIYSYAHECEITGMSIMRPLVYEYQDDVQVMHIKDEYLFGRELLVAPMLCEGDSKRDVYFPQGTWIDWDYGYVYEGSKRYEVYAPQNRIPLFMKKGAIIPMLQKNYRNGKVADLTKLTIRILPEQESTFRLYHDDGETTAYQEGSFTETCIQVIDDEQNVHIRTTASNEAYAPVEFLFEVFLDYEPASIQINDEDIQVYAYRSEMEKQVQGAYFDYFQKKVWVKVQSIGLENRVDVTYNLQAPLVRIRKGQDEENKGQLPYLYPPAKLPCRMQAENFDRGGEGIAYHIQHPASASLFRDDAVDIRKSDDVTSGYMVCQLIKGDWLEYTVHVPQNDTYYARIRVKATALQTAFTMDVNTQTMSGLLEPQTVGCFETLQTKDVFLSEGDQVIRIFVKEGTMDFNWFEILKKEK